MSNNQFSPGSAFANILQMVNENNENIPPLKSLVSFTYETGFGVAETHIPTTNKENKKHHSGPVPIVYQPDLEKRRVSLTKCAKTLIDRSRLGRRIRKRFRTNVQSINCRICTDSNLFTLPCQIINHKGTNFRAFVQKKVQLITQRKKM